MNHCIAIARFQGALLSWFALTIVAFAAQPGAATATKPIPVLLDTDIGTDIDDAFALALLLNSPEIELQAITTVGQQADDRAWLVCRFLTQCGRGPLPVAAGQPPQPDTRLNDQIQYRQHPAAIFNRTLKPVKQSAVELLHERIVAATAKPTLVAVGPLTNIARLLTEHPEVKDRIERIVLMGGAVRIGYNGKPPAEPEWNIKLDVPAARAVFASGVPLTIVPLDATVSARLTAAYRQRLFAFRQRHTFQLQNLYELWNQETPTLFDAVAAAVVFQPRFCQFEDLALTIADNGATNVATGRPIARVATSVDADKFLDWFVERLKIAEEPIVHRPPENRATLVEQGPFPARVHVAEDYDTDIERRWWMSGKPEKTDLPPGSRRACRGVLTQDFDDRMGDTLAMYRAVIFNPVPGPPMGPSTRLSFRYKLRGADTIRVQLYSLTNGYHRYLSVAGLAQNQWTHAAVDMTAMRRPDGSGGPLGKDERIDDIQFYVPTDAELLIDDVVLYDAGDAQESRPFPRRIMFTAWFDTGKQGKEWPGSFEIAPHEPPQTWKYARSVSNLDSASAWIQLSLRGDRRLATRTQLTFRRWVHGADKLRVELFHQGKPLVGSARELTAIVPDQWSTSTLAFDFPDADRQDRLADEIRLVLPAGGELRLDDVLLYEPGSSK